jgi:hypothetical protein
MAHTHDGRTHALPKRYEALYYRLRRGPWCREELDMRTPVALLIAVLVISALVSSCAAQWPTTPAATPCALIERCRNPALTTGGA